MPVVIKSPNPDDVWDRWKRKFAKSQNLEKHYQVKGAVFKLEDITAAEYIKGVNKAAVIYFEKKYDVKVVAGKAKAINASVKEVEKEKFYQFKNSPVKADWKGKEEVPSIKTLQKVSCSKCSGKGGTNCKKCNGSKQVTCPDCEGKILKCKKCEGTGKYNVEITVFDEKDNKSTQKMEVNCSNCYGTGKLSCLRCNGTGKIACKTCVGMGLVSCSDCSGYGSKFNYEIRPVPFKEEHSAEPVILSSIKLSGIEKEVGKEIQQTIEQVEGILIKNPESEFNQKFVEPNLGYYPKEVKKIVEEALKEWKSASKTKEVKIPLPMFIFPLLSLDCETKKGKKFQVYCIGSDKLFQVYGKI